MSETPVGAFVRAVGSPREAVWDERVGAVEVRVDDGLASAWMPYAFYVGPTFSHCGVNSFHLVRAAEGWRAVSVADTRRRQACEVAPPGGADEAAVRAAFAGLFDAMRAADTTAVRAAFLPGGRFLATSGAGDGLYTQAEGVDAFVAAVAQAGAGVLDERVGAIEVRLDDGLATARAPYTFYANGAFSHCGVDEAQLVRTADSWKVLALSYTAREGCGSAGR